MEYSRSFNIDIPVPRVCTKELNIRVKESLLQRRLRKRTSRICLKDSCRNDEPPHKYPLRTNVIKRDEVLLPYRLFAKEQDKRKHNHQLNVTIRQKYKMKLSKYRSRLHVNYPFNAVKAVTDIDKDYFNYINGRHFIDRAPIYKTLKVAVSDLLRKKLEIGYRNDEIYKIQSNCRNETTIYERSLENYDKQTKYLDSFISADYRKSIALLKRCDDFDKKVNKMLQELQLLADQQFTIESSLIGLDFMFHLQQSYGRFLYYLSPPSWRANNRKFAHSVEIEVKGFDLGGSDEASFDVTFDKMQNECLSNIISPALYFTHPDQLLHLFEDIEKQQLGYIEYVTHIAPLLKQAKENKKMLKDIIIQDSAFTLSTINSFEAVLEFSEQRCAQLESKFHKIVNGLFYDSVGTPEVLKIFSDLEFCYEKLYSEKPINPDIFALAKDLEAFYMFYWKRLDEIVGNNSRIKNVVKRCEEIESKKYRRAKHANRELSVFECLKIGLVRAFAPAAVARSAYERNKSVSKFYKTEISKKLKKKNLKHDKSKTTALKTLTPAQLEYLELFTEWNFDEDPSKYLHLNSIDEIKQN